MGTERWAITTTQDRLGDRFHAGAVLHTGPLPFHLDDRIATIPIASLWAPR